MKYIYSEILNKKIWGREKNKVILIIINLSNY